MSQRSSLPCVVHMMFFEGVTNARGSRASAVAGARSPAATAAMTTTRRIGGASLPGAQGPRGGESARVERRGVDGRRLAADELREEAAGDRAEPDTGALVSGRRP